MFSYVYNDLDIAHKFDENPVPISDYTKHFHDFYELYYFVQGNLIYTVEDETNELKTSNHLCGATENIILIQPGQHHFVTLIDQLPYERYVLKFPASLVPEFVRDAFANRSAFYNSLSLDPLFEELEELSMEYNERELELLFSGVITEILIRLCRLGHHEKKFRSGNTISLVIQYINENLRKPLTVDDLCKEFHFSQSYLHREFHAHMRIPIMKYIRSKKIIAASQLINRGETPSRVSEKFGFLDYSTFYRSFVIVMGFPPSYRNRKMNEIIK